MNYHKIIYAHITCTASFAIANNTNYDTVDLFFRSFIMLFVIDFRVFANFDRAFDRLKFIDESRIRFSETLKNELYLIVILNCCVLNILL